MTETKAEKFEFQSEIKQLLKILIYSLYKNKEVFLRELVSNALDALSRVQFEIMTNEEVEDRSAQLRIDISFNKAQSKLIIEDNGIGMTRDELVKNIGTIAHSGAVDFLKKLSETQEKDRLELIGKFGVGFYSSFMVARQVHVYTKSFQKGSPAYLWKSTGDSDFTVEEAVKKERGTRIELLLKKDEKEFLEKPRIKAILSRYSKFVPFPIYLEGEKVEVAEAIWAQPKSILNEKDYQEFYKFFNNTQEEPEIYFHLSSDAPVQFNAVLFIPKTSFEFFGIVRAESGVDLYSRKVLIQKNCKDLMPEYLRVVRGVIDSEDIPLNISRETIQSNFKIGKIRKFILKRLFARLIEVKKKDREKYLRIWNNFSRHFKEGIVSDFENKKTLSQLLLFHSSKEERKERVDLRGYVDRMGKEQKEIYYITGLDLDSIEKNPALEAFKRKDIEVLFLDDPLDEFVIEHLGEHEGRSFKKAESADIKIDKSSEESRDHLKDVEAFLVYLKDIYKDKVIDVKISDRLIESPCMLVHPAGGPSVQVEKILKMANKNYQYAKKILEINPDNKLIKEMARIYKTAPQSGELKALALQLLDNMFLREGIIDDVDNTVSQIQGIMLQAARNIRSRADSKKKKNK